MKGGTKNDIKKQERLRNKETIYTSGRVIWSFKNLSVAETGIEIFPTTWSEDSVEDEH